MENLISKLPDDCWYEVILHLGLSEVIKLNITSHYFHRLVREYKITDGGHVVTIGNGDICHILLTLTNKYNFKKFYFENPQLTYWFFKLFRNVHTLYLEDCSIDDYGLASLQHLHTLGLRNCQRITDKGLKHLRGLDTVYLNGCFSITNIGLTQLAKIKHLYVWEYFKIDINNMDDCYVLKCVTDYSCYVLDALGWRKSFIQRYPTLFNTFKRNITHLIYHKYVNILHNNTKQ